MSILVTNATQRCLKITPPNKQLNHCLYLTLVCATCKHKQPKCHVTEFRFSSHTLTDLPITIRLPKSRLAWSKHSLMALDDCKVLSLKLRFSLRKHLTSLVPTPIEPAV